MRRFFIDPSCLSGDSATITGQEARHISSVLRLKPGRTIELLDGNGMVYQAEIRAVGKSTITAKILRSRCHQERPPFLDVAQSLVKGKKMDLILQKATELGVSTFQPLISQHCDIKTVPNGQTDRWQRIAHEACKQCNRPAPMVCAPAVSFDQFLRHADKSATKFILWEHESTGILPRQLTAQNERVIILIGPEGGFAEVEVQLAFEHGFTPVTLGPRILRAETATIAAISIIQFLLGNLTKPEIPNKATAPYPSPHTSIVSERIP